MKGLPFILLMFVGLLSGCASNDSDSSQSENTKATEYVDIKESGVVTPKYNGNIVVGYEYTTPFAIPAALKSGFGFSYEATKALYLKVSESGDVATLPVKVTVTHPPMKQANGSESTSSSWNDTLYFNRINYTTWLFESKAELVPGNWEISLSYRGEVLAKKAYLVVIPRPTLTKLTSVCSADESLYPAPLASAHNACCNNDDADACYNFAWRGVERQKDTVGAVLYYGRSCDLGSASGCRTAGNLAESDEGKAEWFNKGCDLKDLDSCLEVDRLPY